MKQINIRLDEKELKKALEKVKKQFGIKSTTGLFRYLIKQYLSRLNES